MPTELERIELLEKQIAHTITRAQAEALVAALGTDHTTLSQTLSTLQALVNQLIGEMSSMKTSIADHETRIDALEGP